MFYEKQKKASSFSSARQPASTTMPTPLGGLPNSCMLSLLNLGEENAPNQTGLPDAMKERFEKRFGFALDDVRVHRNSYAPAALYAEAYAKGNEIFLGPGQEKHLEHELGHVVQQKAGLVKPTGSMNGELVNEDDALELGADGTPMEYAVRNNMRSPVVQRFAWYARDGKSGAIHLKNDSPEGSSGSPSNMNETEKGTNTPYLKTEDNTWEKLNSSPDMKNSFEIEEEDATKPVEKAIEDTNNDYYFLSEQDVKNYGLTKAAGNHESLNTVNVGQGTMVLHTSKIDSDKKRTLSDLGPNLDNVMLMLALKKDKMLQDLVKEHYDAIAGSLSPLTRKKLEEQLKITTSDTTSHEKKEPDKATDKALTAFFTELNKKMSIVVSHRHDDHTAGLPSDKFKASDLPIGQQASLKNIVDKDFKSMQIDQTKSSDENTNSLVLYKKAGNTFFLLPGDQHGSVLGNGIEQNAVKKELDNSMYKAVVSPHHGSATGLDGSNYPKGLGNNVTQVVSAGIKNQFNHPTNEFNSRTSELGHTVMDTRHLQQRIGGAVVKATRSSKDIPPARYYKVRAQGEISLRGASAHHDYPIKDTGATGCKSLNLDDYYNAYGKNKFSSALMYELFNLVWKDIGKARYNAEKSIKCPSKKEFICAAIEAVKKYEDLANEYESMGSEALKIEKKSKKAKTKGSKDDSDNYEKIMHLGRAEAAKKCCTEHFKEFIGMENSGGMENSEIESNKILKKARTSLISIKHKRSH